MEQYNKLINKFYKRLILESIINSSLYGVLVASIVSIITCIILYFSNVKYLWISIVVFVAIYLIVTTIMYFFKFKPSKKEVAKRIDLEGLEERMITMYECENCDSFMAKKQREDALTHFDKVKDKKIKFRVSKTMSYVALSVLTLGIITNSIVGTSFVKGSSIPSIDEIVTNEDTQLNVSYFVEEGGFIVGDEFQIVLKGQNSSPVLAVPEDGYMFESWSDGNENPERQDFDIKQNNEYFAIFLKIEEDFEPSDLEDEEPSDEEMGNIDSDEMPDHASGSAGRYEEANQVIDGETYYRDVFEEYYQEALNILNSGGELPSYLREIIEQYYGTIK